MANLGDFFNTLCVYASRPSLFRVDTSLLHQAECSGQYLSKQAFLKARRVVEGTGLRTFVGTEHSRGISAEALASERDASRKDTDQNIYVLADVTFGVRFYYFLESCAWIELLGCCHCSRKCGAVWWYFVVDLMFAFPRFVPGFTASSCTDHSHETSQSRVEILPLPQAVALVLFVPVSFVSENSSAFNFMPQCSRSFEAVSFR